MADPAKDVRQERQEERRFQAERRELLRTERRILNTADILAILMVAATAMTAFAT